MSEKDPNQDRYSNPFASPTDGEIPAQRISSSTESVPASSTSASAPLGAERPIQQLAVGGAAGDTGAVGDAVVNPAAQYGANRFWGSPGYTDPMGAARAQSVGADGQHLKAGAYPGQDSLHSAASWTAASRPKQRKGPGWLGVIGIALAASLLSSGAMYGVLELRPGHAEAGETTLFNPKDQGATTPEPVVNSTSKTPDWEAVAQAVRPAVVAISVTAKSAGDQGSGAIIDSSGHILTNNHVVADAAGSNGQIAVELSDGRLYEAEITGRDVLTDLAVIKLKNPPKDLTVVTLGDSDELEVGEAVAAIGNPLGLSSTVTTGIVSALNRPVQVQAVQGGSSSLPGGGTDLGDLQDLFNQFGFPGLREESRQDSQGQSAQRQEAVDSVTTNAIQVDAAVNPGNSGGPLFDVKGRVIGVTSSIASMAENSSQAGSIGLGFAIPINQASMIAEQLIKHGEAVHAALGVRVTEQIATVGDVSRLGAEVAEVMSDSAASKAGLRQGDIILGIDGEQVKGASSLVGWVRQYAVGEAVELDIVRDGKEKRVTVVLQAQ